MNMTCIAKVYTNFITFPSSETKNNRERDATSEIEIKMIFITLNIHDFRRAHFLLLAPTLLTA